MSNQDYSQDPNQQQGGQFGQDPSQQYGRQQDSGTGQDPNAGQPQTGQGGMFADAQQQAQNQVDTAIDQFADRLPGGQQVAGQAKDQANQALENVERDAEGRMGNLGGMPGGGQNNP